MSAIPLPKLTHTNPIVINPSLIFNLTTGLDLIGTNVSSDLDPNSQSGTNAIVFTMQPQFQMRCPKQPSSSRPPHFDMAKVVPTDNPQPNLIAPIEHDVGSYVSFDEEMQSQNVTNDDRAKSL